MSVYADQPPMKIFSCLFLGQINTALLNAFCEIFQEIEFKKMGVCQNTMDGIMKELIEC